MNTLKKTKITRKIRKKVARVRRQLNKRTKAKINRLRRKINTNRLPAARTKSFKRIFNITSQDGNSMTVKGRDLVYAIPDTLTTTQNTSVITVIPSNPCYWTGTRVAALASGYQNFRPLMFKVSYVPQCAVTQQGNVIAGTLWNTLPSPSNFQQTLRTSPGGMMTQCYKPATTAVTMKSNLQFNLFRCAGKFDQESNPFTYIALAIATVNENNQRIIPGYFYVDYAYTFKNPIGYSHVFFNSGMTTPQEHLDMDYENMALISCATGEQAALGALIQADIVDNQLVYTFNETTVNLQPQQPVWYFCSSTIEYNARPPQPEPEPEEPQPLYIDLTSWDDTSNLINNRQQFVAGVQGIIYGDNGEEEEARQYQVISYAQWANSTYTPINLLDQQFRNNAVFFTGRNSTNTNFIAIDSPQSVTYTRSPELGQFITTILTEPGAELILGPFEANKIHKHNEAQNKIVKIQPNFNINQILEEDDQEDKIVNEYLDRNDIHNDKDIKELEEKLKQLRIKKEK